MRTITIPFRLKHSLIKFLFDNNGILDNAGNGCSSPTIKRSVFFQGFESSLYTGDLGNGVIIQGAGMGLYDKKMLIF